MAALLLADADAQCAAVSVQRCLQGFRTPDEVATFGRLMAGMADIVVHKYNGSLKVGLIILLLLLLCTSWVQQQKQLGAITARPHAASKRSMWKPTTIILTCSSSDASSCS